MALYVHSTSGSPPKVVSEITRKSVSYHPSIWGTKFLAYNDSSVVKTDLDHEEEEHLQLLKQEIKKMLIAEGRSQQELISLIDDIQRLRLSYHFEAEIDTLLQHIKDRFHEYYGRLVAKLMMTYMMLLCILQIQVQQREVQRELG